MLSTHQKTKRFKKKLLKNQTRAELEAEKLLKTTFGKQILIEKQHPICVRDFDRKRRFFYLDFFLPHYLLAIEIDGGIHKTRDFQDVQRDLIIMRWSKILTIRFSNEDIFKRQNFFIKVVRESIESRKEFLPNYRNKYVDGKELLGIAQERCNKYSPETFEKRKKLAMVGESENMKRLIEKYG